MPSNWLVIDTNFPTFTGEEPAEQQIAAMLNYLYIMKEQLQYTLRNLTADNWNATALQSLTDAAKSDVTEQLQVYQNQLSQLSNKVDSLSGRVSGAENIAGRMDTAEGKITALEGRQDAEEENSAALWQAAEEIADGLEALQGRVYAIEQQLQTLVGIIQVTEEGITIGAEGKALHLIGEIYINGVLYGQGETET